VAAAVAVAVLAAAAATGDDSYLDLLRPALDTMIENGKVMAFADADSSLPVKWYPQLGEAVTTPTMLVPFRHSARGWFDGSQLGRPPGNGRKAADLYAQLLAAEPHADQFVLAKPHSAT
jgi:hypothetical protein